jgi:glutamate N-acetyltransferase/amino-acid N-acetyltransferase
MGPLALFERGAPVAFDEDEALRVLAAEEILIDLDLDCGASEATVWTCDLTEKYIEINGSYRT